MSDIFISYSHEDKEYAHRLEKELKKRGFKVWIDDRINYGAEWPTFIQENLDGCEALVLIMTPRSLKSMWVQNELMRARRKKKTIFPLLLEGDEPWLSIEIIQYIDVTNGQLPSEEFYKTLGNDVSERKTTSHPPELVEEKPTITAPKAPRKKRLAFGIGAVALIVILIVIGWFLYSKPPYAKTFKNSIGMKFVKIPAGNFMMGSRISPQDAAQKYGGNVYWFKPEHPQHSVEITKPFYMQSTEVTQKQWESVMGENPSTFKDCGGDCPVENVSLDKVQEFIRRLNKRSEGQDYRLPTEAEWEYANRAGTKTEFSFGDEANMLDGYAWYSDNSEMQTHFVGQKKPNAWGLSDIHGNVWEWVEDDFHYTYDGAPSDGSAWIDESRGADHVIRGGSWNNGARRCRSAIRFGVEPSYRSGMVGFRLARSVAFDP
jgi:formylglycine-generating enzyme required for sulfatase activity